MNRPDSLERTLNVMASSNGLPNQIIVVDQSETIEDRIKNELILRSFENKFIDVKYVIQNVPSLTKARNNGLAYVANEIVVMSDDDVDVKPDSFAHIHQLFQDETIAMVGGINELDNLAQQSLLGVLFGKSSYRKRYIGHVTKSVYGRFPLHCEETTPSEWAMGFFFVVRKSLTDRWGIRFDEHLQYYAYAEDLDFTYNYYKHAKKEGLKCIISSLLTVRHNVSTEYRIPTKKQTYMVILHRRYICAKHKMGLFAEIACIWCDFGDVLYRALHKQSILNVLSALFFYIKHRSDIKKGEFHYSKFM